MGAEWGESLTLSSTRGRWRPLAYSPWVQATPCLLDRQFEELAGEINAWPHCEESAMLPMAGQRSFRSGATSSYAIGGSTEMAI